MTESQRQQELKKLLKAGEVVVNSDENCLYQIREVQVNNVITFKPICKIHNTDQCYYNLKNLIS